MSSSPSVSTNPQSLSELNNVLHAFSKDSYATFSSMQSAIERHGINNGVIICRRGTPKMDKVRAMRLFNCDDVIQSGYFYCRCRPRSLASKCKFVIPFTFDAVQEEYVFKIHDRRFNCQHNHVSGVPPEIDGITMERQMTETERLHMLTFLPSLRGVKIRQSLQRHFPTRHFAPSLIQRMVAKGRVQLFGPDPDAINTLMRFGHQIADDGGVFTYEVDDSLRLNRIFIQKPSMVPYCSTHADFTICDGTFNVSAYDLMLIIMSNVDYIGRTVMTGFVFAESENSHAIVDGMKQFGLNRPDSIFMTDGASSFANASESLQLQHVLCLQHYRSNVFTASAGMPHYLRNLFIDDCNAFLFSIFDSERKLDDAIDSACEKYRNFPAAVKSLPKRKEDRVKTCATHTGKNFTAGHVASQRAEFNNARVKQDSDFKKDLKKFNLLEIVQHLVAIVTQQEIDTFVVVKALITQNRRWSDYVKRKWGQEAELVNRYRSELLNDYSEGVWSVT